MAAAASAASAAAARISAVLSDAQYFESGMVRVEDIRRLLDSRALKDKLDAMKRIVALISLGRDASIFFPDVVKNVVAPSLDIKKLVYLYLVHYAEDKQDLALLSINSFQKDISDPNQLIRAMALRVLSSIRVKVILQIVILAINKCAKDPSPYVRKAAAHAICKVCCLDASSRDLLIEPLAVLLNDRSLEVLGSAVAVLEEVAPDRFDMIHSHFRHLCTTLPDIDPYGQVAVLRLLLRYGRTQFVDPTSQSEPHPDFALLLASVHPLLLSRSPSVVIAVITLYYHVASLEQLKAYAILPLMRLVSSADQGVQLVALRVAYDIVSRAPGVFLPYLPEFFVTAADGIAIRDKKLAVLTRMCEMAAEPCGLGSDSGARRTLLIEFEFYLNRCDKALAAAATRAMGHLASTHAPSTSAVVDILSTVVASSTNKVVVSESVTVLRRLLQLHPDAQSRALPRLVALLLIPKSDKVTIEAPEARSAIVWLIGEFYDKAPHVAPEALRLLAQDFRREHAQVKLQILNLAAKVLAWHLLDRTTSEENAAVTPDIRLKLLDYLTACALYDADYDVRDKARLFRHVFVDKFNSTVLAAACEAVLDGNRPCNTSKLEVDHIRLPKNSESMVSDAVIASMSHVMGRRLHGCRPLPPWGSVNSASKHRDEGSGIVRTGGGVLELSSISSTSFNAFGHNDVSSTNGSTLQGIAHSQSRPLGKVSETYGGKSMASGMTRPYRNINPEHFYNSQSDTAGSGDKDDDEYSYETDSDDEPDESSAHSNSVHSAPAILESRTKSTAEVSDMDLLFAALSSRDESTLSPGAAAFESVLLLDNNVNSIGSTGHRSLEDRISSSSLSTSWHRVIEGWSASGIQLDVSFVRGSFEGGINATPLLLRITNIGKNDKSDLFVKSSAGILNVRREMKPVTVLPGRSVEFNAFAMFGGKTIAVPLSVYQGDSALGMGELRPSAGYVMKPNPSLTFHEFEAKEKSLGGMFGCTTRLVMPAENGAKVIGSSMDSFLRRARRQILEKAFLAEICGGSALNGILLFAGFLPPTVDEGSTPEKSDVLVRFRVDLESPLHDESAAASGSLWIGCENVLFANNLAQLLKRAVCGTASA